MQTGIAIVLALALVLFGAWQRDEAASLREGRDTAVVRLKSADREARDAHSALNDLRVRRRTVSDVEAVIEHLHKFCAERSERAHGLAIWFKPSGKEFRGLCGKGLDA